MRRATANPDALRSTPRAGPAALSLCVMLAALGTSITNVALPAMAHDLAGSFAEVQWIVLAYLLAVTTTVVGAGRLGDLTGRRRLLLAGVVTFSGASALCGAAPSLELLIAARAVQGLGAAVMLALPMALIADISGRTGRAMGLLGTASAIGTALGPALGGALIAGSGWRAIFFLQVVLGLLALALALHALPVDEPRRTDGFARLDVPGMVVLGVTLGCYALAATVGGGGFSGTGAGLLLAAALGVGLFVAVERRTGSPLVAPAVFRDFTRTAGLMTSALVSTVLMTTLVVGPFYLAGALRLPPAQVGLVMAVGPVVAALAGVPAGRATDRFGAESMVLVGLAAVLAGCLALTVTPIGAGRLGYVVPLVIITAGYALFQAANNTAVMTGAEPDRRGVVSALLNLARNLGLISGAAIMGAVFARTAGDVTTADGLEIAAGTQRTFALAAALILLGIFVAARGRRPGTK